jgi:ankyrin repeat protein
MMRFLWFAVFMSAAGIARAGPLFDAAAAGNVAETRALLSQNVDVEQQGPNRETPLIAAALADQTEIASLLIENGANVMARNRGGLTPLHAAAYVGSTGVAKLLLDHGAAVDDHANFSGATPLIVAVEENRVAVAELLLDHGADLNANDRDGFSALTNAWSKGRLDAVRLLKAKGAVCQPVEVLGTDEYRRKCVEAGQ